LTNACVIVFAGLNQVSASLNRFKPHVWQKQVFAGRNPTLREKEEGGREGEPGEGKERREGELRG